MRIGSWARDHRAVSTAAAAIAVGLGVFVLVWFEPQKLFLDQTVNEAAPGAITMEPQTPTAAERPAPEAPMVKLLASGGFRSLEHATSGRAVVLQQGGDPPILRFENLETSNGPDLRVYLSEVPASDDWHAYGERYLDLGALKGNIGNQNYEIPRGTDLSRFESAVIWCRRFSVGFGVASLDL
jgi:hypothetical protein